MKISLDNAPYIDRSTGLPLEGRIRVYLADSDVLADVCTLEGTDYVKTVNPLLLHAGLTDDSLFVDLGLYRICVDRYTGPEGQMSTESPSDYFEQVDVLEFGLDYDPQSASTSTVSTLEDLQNTDTALGTVTVLWHSTAGDCFPRTYIWDKNSQDTIDGGYVVGSEKSDTGRWILLWGDEILPCSVYGIKPGSEGNINTFLSYPEYVGSFRLVTAPCVRFGKGTYNSSVTFFTAKEVCFDGGAQFPNATFSCPRIRKFGTFGDYIADFYFSDKSTVAHSSDFKTLDVFLSCGADTLVVDNTNYFKSKQINRGVSLANKRIEGSVYIGAVYGTGGSLAISKCHISAKGIFGPNTKVSFTGMTFNEEWWTSMTASTWDFGRLNDGHKIQYMSTSLNKTSRKDFVGQDYVWLKMRTAEVESQRALTPSPTLDLEGATIANAYGIAKPVTLKNGHFKGDLNLATGKGSVTLEDIVVDGSTYLGSPSTCWLTRCKLRLGSEIATGTVTATDCDLDSMITFSTPIAWNLKGGSFGINLNYAKDNDTQIAAFQARDVQFNRSNNYMRLKKAYFYDCSLEGQYIRIYPYKYTSGSTTEYWFKGAMVNCRVNGTYPIRYTMFNNKTDGMSDLDCKNAKIEWDWLGNTFSGNRFGISFRVFAQTGVNTLLVGPGPHKIHYDGNMGQCPMTKVVGYYENYEGAWKLASLFYSGKKWYVRQMTDAYAKGGYYDPSEGTVQLRVFPSMVNISSLARDVKNSWGTYSVPFLCYGVYKAFLDYAYPIQGSDVGFTTKVQADLTEVEDDTNIKYDMFDVVAVSTRNDRTIEMI